MATGISLHIGLNYLDPARYNGWNGELNAAEFDAEDMALIASINGYTVNKLIRNEATKERILTTIKQAAATLKSGDIFFVTFSGHGGQKPDTNADEDDALDETWCLYDYEILDDELYYYWNQFKEGVRILVISDSCHSGSVSKFKRRLPAMVAEPYKSRSMPLNVAMSTYLQNKTYYDKIQKDIKPVDPSKIAASLKLFSACQDPQEAMDGPFNGRFTGILKAMWNGGKFRGNYYQFYKQILNRFYEFPEQTPNYSSLGKQITGYDNQNPFTI